MGQQPVFRLEMSYQIRRYLLQNHLSQRAFEMCIRDSPNPKGAMSDAAQQLTPKSYQELFEQVRTVAEAVHREV